mmetsp:Transcript_14214/g.28685  ORF Transcript_14214/g.28685 Transcript_14214/m.28685 type:complete len:90 (-) Transcript_14214:933-1202(-)
MPPPKQKQSIKVHQKRPEQNRSQRKMYPQFQATNTYLLRKVILPLCCLFSKNMDFEKGNKDHSGKTTCKQNHRYIGEHWRTQNWAHRVI